MAPGGQSAVPRAERRALGYARTMPDPGDTSERRESSGPHPDGAGDREPDPGGKGDEPSQGGLVALRHLRAAQLRASAARGGLVKITFGTVFLVGALAHALSPQRHEQSSLFWITLLLLMSTVNVALGLRSVGRARRRVAHAWLPLSAAWGVLAVVLLGLLMRR